MRLRLSVFVTLIGLLFGCALMHSGARAQTFQFAPPPSTQSNIIYRVNTLTGEMGACGYSTNDANGITFCYPLGDGAGAQPAGRYRILGSNMSTEGGVFRVNEMTGEVSVCYIKNNMLVCTPAAK
jgi:hypothetical protein